MGGRKGSGVSSKVAAANEKKATNDAMKAEKERQQLEAEAAKDWSKGSNLRGQSRSEATSAKADEVARKRREKEDLLAAEEEGSSGTTTKLKKDVGSGMKSKQSKKKTKQKNDLFLLEDSLISAADKKSKVAKKKQREAEEKKKKESPTQPQQQQPAGNDQDALLANTATMIGNHEPASVGRRANVLAGESFHESGVDGALRALQTGPTDDAHPEKRVKALHKAFEERAMPEMKRDYPGLKMSQYKEKIFILWKKSPENPLNHRPGNNND